MTAGLFSSALIRAFTGKESIDTGLPSFPVAPVSLAALGAIAHNAPAIAVTGVAVEQSAGFSRGTRET